LTDSTGDAVVRDLLQAGKNDGKGPNWARHALASYAQTQSAGRVRGSTWRLAIKLLGSAVLAGALSVGWMDRRSTHGSSATPPASVAIRDVPVVRSPAPLATPEEPPTMRLVDLPSVRSPAKRSAPRPTGTTATVTAAPTPTPAGLRDELALVEAARASLARNESEECLRALDVHDGRFGDGVLADEVAAMRIEALVAHGERDRALALGEAFLSAKPESPYALRIQSILAPSR
jgi:hypothetical protein